MTEELYWAIAALLHSILDFGSDHPGTLGDDVLRNALKVSEHYIKLEAEWPSLSAEVVA
jgi:hypothetical protein